ncbi:hypothetical protein [Adhaeribacter radiodurans]|uniref:Uncharacterized protein n=1 Tax=Adhaeribacter radiodurans TaxID=2745197 RepID=A0A7L7L6C4_9BACT|nr:hypothetical protein [Adhaeribacter radiodurans]QMU28350.1 hypothetical protein HUW48_10030 [Adhaeribacter radiodurans]
MARLLKHIIDNLDVEKLSVEEAKKALFYIDFHLDSEGNFQTVMRFMKMKDEIEKRLIYLNSLLKIVTVVPIAFL